MAIAARAPILRRDFTGHFVRFYQTESPLIDEVVEFARRALRGKGAAVVIATRAHLPMIAPRLARAARGPGAGELVCLDAETALAGFMVDGWPDEERFFATIGALMAGAAARANSAPVHAFGEMVAVLGAAGQYDAALRVEKLWNALAQRLSFKLFCAYPQALFANSEQSRLFGEICRVHGSVLPSEVLPERDHAAADRVIAQWQQKAEALESEIQRRRQAEAALRRRERELADLLVELERASRAKDEFLAMLGHELRNPLSPIVTALQLMRMHSDGATSHEQSIIARQVDHLVRLVDDLLDVSRLTRGKIELRRRTVSVADVLTHAVEMASLLLEQRNHRLTVETGPDLVWCVDAARMAQVVSNMLTNAARYTAVGGEVRVAAWREADDTIAVSVRDNGIGIADKMLPRVFDLFFQGKRNLDRAEGGLGIGLALVKSLVELHGGSVSAASAGPGRGSEFTIRVPARTAAGSGHRFADGPSERAPLPAVPPKDGRRILLVDDNVDGVEALALLLAECGHRVEAVHDPAAALQIVGRFEPEIAVIDIGLPVMDGYQLIGSLRAALGPRRCMFIALTGYGQDADRTRSQAAGFDHHLVKPVDLQHLTSLIDAFDAHTHTHATSDGAEHGQ